MSNSWIFTSNLSKFDSLRAFEDTGEVVWSRKHCRAKVDDIVYIYVKKPIGKIMVKGLITQIFDTDKKEYNYSSYWATPELQEEWHNSTQQYYRIKRIEQVDSEGLSLEILKNEGIITVSKMTHQIQSRGAIASK